MFKFRPGAIYHMKEPTLAGLVNRGWGLPRVLINFRQIWYVQVLRRQNEALALDSVVPFRIITPEPAAGGRLMDGSQLDPFMAMDGNDFRAQAMRMIRARKRDPAGIQVFPFPVNFQMFGADATKLVPAEIMDQALAPAERGLGPGLRGAFRIITPEPAAGGRLMDGSHGGVQQGEHGDRPWRLAG